MKRLFIMMLMVIGLVFCVFTYVAAEDTNKNIKPVIKTSSEVNSEPQVRKAPTLEELQKQYTENEQSKYRIEGAINMLILQKQEKEDIDKRDKWLESNKKDK